MKEEKKKGNESKDTKQVLEFPRPWVHLLQDWYLEFTITLIL